jgi:hypothetical protein
LSDTQTTVDGGIERSRLAPGIGCYEEDYQGVTDGHNRARSPPPQYPQPEASSSSPPGSPRPPPFSSLYDSGSDSFGFYTTSVTEAESSTLAPAYAPIDQQHISTYNRPSTAVADTKAALPQDSKGDPYKKEEGDEPPPAYTEGSSPLHSFTYLMAAAGGAASILTQVQQGGPPINTLGGA